MDSELDDDRADDLAQRFADVSIDSCSTEQMWHRLTETERASFEKFVNSDQVCSLVDLWVPWWYASPEILVEEIGKESTAYNAVPPIFANVQHIDQIAKCGISDLIPFNIINVLYAYAYTARLYNGEHVTMASESVVAMLDISESLSRGVFTNVSLAVGGCLSRLGCSAAQMHFVSRENSVSVVDDVCKLVAGAVRNPVPFPLAALSDCHRIFHIARKEASQELKKSHAGDRCIDDARKRYYAVEKKLEYFISWTSSHGHTLRDFLPSLELEYCELTTQLATYRSEQKRVEEILERKKSESKRGPLIEEIPSGSSF